MIHIEMYDGRVFCGEPSYRYDGVHQCDWHTRNGQLKDPDYEGHDSIAAIQKADCVMCLAGLAALGAAAERRLAMSPPPRSEGM